jgi:hypothetical protein
MEFYEKYRHVRVEVINNDKTEYEKKWKKMAELKLTKS